MKNLHNYCRLQFESFHFSSNNIIVDHKINKIIIIYNFKTKFFLNKNIIICLVLSNWKLTQG